MANPDLLRFDERKAIIEEIEQEENIVRKRFAQRAFDCYRERQANYIKENLSYEFDQNTVNDMRFITSINLTKRIVDELSSIYTRAPKRQFEEVSDRELEQIENLYKYSKFNSKMKVANVYYNLQNQNVLYIIPQDRTICVKPLPLQSFDVVPDSENSEKAYAYILNTWDMDLKNNAQKQEYSSRDARYSSNNSLNEKIADPNDRLSEHAKMVVWTDEYTYTMDRKGEFVGEPVENPIGRMPFIDNANGEKDSQFFVRRGSDIAEFGIEMGTILTDVATTARDQHFGQGVIYSVKQPKEVRGNHNKWLWLQLDPERPEARPELQFVSPNADIPASLEMIQVLLNMFLTSRGLDTSVITGKGQATTPSSGIEKLLQMIDRFEASQDDFDAFKSVEHKAFDLMRDWSNYCQNINEGKLALDPELRISSISDSAKMSVQFQGPEAIKSDEEKLNELERKMELGIISRKMMIMEYYEVSEDRALEIMSEIDSDLGLSNAEAG